MSLAPSYLVTSDIAFIKSRMILYLKKIPIQKCHCKIKVLSCAIAFANGCVHYFIQSCISKAVALYMSINFIVSFEGPRNFFNRIWRKFQWSVRHHGTRLNWYLENQLLVNYIVLENKSISHPPYNAQVRYLSENACTWDIAVKGRINIASKATALLYL